MVDKINASRSSCPSALHFLVISQDSIGRDLLSLILKRHGAKVQIVHRPEDAVPVMTEQEFDAVFVDIRWIDLDLAGVTTQVNGGAGIARTRIIVLVEEGDPRLEKVAASHGVDTVITHPLRSEEVARVLAGLVYEVPPASGKRTG